MNVVARWLGAIGLSTCPKIINCFNKIHSPECKKKHTHLGKHSIKASVCSRHFTGNSMYALGELRTEVLITSLEEYGSLILDLAEALGEGGIWPPITVSHT